MAKERFDRLLALVQEICRKKARPWRESEAVVLVEEKNAQDPRDGTGRLDNNSVVHLKGCEADIGHYIPVGWRSAGDFTISARGSHEKELGKNDWILLGTLAAVCLILFCVFRFLSGSGGDRVVITVDGETYGTYSLAEDQHAI